MNLGAFTDASQRDMAIEAGLKREYDLSYAPLSSANHGDWPAVREAGDRAQTTLIATRF